jgi:hypothetical protein
MELFKLFGSVLIDNKDAIDKLNKTNATAETTASKLGKWRAVRPRLALLLSVWVRRRLPD